jgi:hypothetical protein
MNESDPEDTAYYFKDGSLVFTRPDFVTLPQRSAANLRSCMSSSARNLAATLGYGTEVKSLPEDVVEKIAGEADELIENWESESR